MKILRPAVAGTLESSDVQIRVFPVDSLEITIDSTVGEQFGEAINDTTRNVLREHDVENGRIEINDHGALDCTIRARLTTVLQRAAVAEEA